jgi:hypothetical protein
MALGERLGHGIIGDRSVLGVGEDSSPQTRPLPLVQVAQVAGIVPDRRGPPHTFVIAPM